MASKPGLAILHPLKNADGSVAYTAPNGSHKIIAGVNYPVEVPYRSDEIPESTVIEVNLRPHNGVGMVKERHVESIVKQTLQAIVLGNETPRTMLQVTLQIAGVEPDEMLPGGIKEGGQGETYLPVLVGAINASVLGCLDAGVQMRQLVGAALVVIRDDLGELIQSPTVQERKLCQSLHVFGFTSHGKTLLMESEGNFTIDEWTEAHGLARKMVLGLNDNREDDDVQMKGDNLLNESTDVITMMRRALQARVSNDERWRAD